MPHVASLHSLADTGMIPPRLPFDDLGDVCGTGFEDADDSCGVAGVNDVYKLFAAATKKQGQRTGKTSRAAPKAAPVAKLKLDGKVCLVTGSSSGIGAGVVMAYAEQGANVVINYRAGDSKQRISAWEAGKLISEMGCAALIAPCDVSKEDQVNRMVQKTIETFGQIDVLVNNAGIATQATIDKMSVSMWDQLISVNLRSVFLCTHAVLPHMYRQNGGKIINTVSQLAYKGSPGLAHYCAAKGAILSFTRSLALEIGSRNINANCVGPGATMTPMLEDVGEEVLSAIKGAIPMGKFAEIEDIVPTYVFLASDESKHYQGQCLSPNGGDAFL
jgi:3-oxoacyl-[acyl-carrier protein] reductase